MRHSFATFGLLCLLSGCDILFPEPVSLAQQLEYAPQIRERLQIFSRWWTLIAPLPQATTPAWPLPPITIPKRFPAGASSAADFAGGPVSPTVGCSTNACTVQWRNSTAPTPYAVRLTVAADGSILAGSAVITEATYGVWRHLYGPDLAPKQALLWRPTLTPIASWTVTCDATALCHYLAEYRSGILAHGDTQLSGAGAGVLDVRTWAKGFPWLGAPVTVAVTRDANLRQAHVAYANGMQWQRRVDLAARTWLQRGPADIRADGGFDGDRWRVRAQFDDTQALFSWELSTPATTAVLPRTFLETRQNTRGRRRDVHAELTEINATSLMLTWNETNLRGVLQAQRDPMGWRIDAFWDTAFGDLMKISGFAYDTGLWLGTFEGWSPDDINMPTEAGDWTLLPDGSFRALILFVQSDRTLTELDSYSPPEGVAPQLLDTRATIP